MMAFYLWKDVFILRPPHFDKSLVIHPLRRGQSRPAMGWWWADLASIYRRGTVILWAGTHKVRSSTETSAWPTALPQDTCTSKQPNTKHICNIAGRQFEHHRMRPTAAGKDAGHSQIRTNKHLQLCWWQTASAEPLHKGPKSHLIYNVEQQI